jgi:alkanesulfonate monooxygenase SsuD/methylene tetrahydromethanopterin reductase-like flavin-dependent oxidoreductase (luciferase family)
MTHRHPSVLATEVVTIDHVSGGRLECAVGAAWNEDEHRELGIPFPAARERMERLEEGVQVLRLLMSGERVSFDGAHYRLDGALYRPRPVQRPHPPIWIGADGMRRSLPIVGRRADVWHSNGRDLAAKWDVVRAAAEDAGRDPEEIARATTLSISEGWDDVRRAFERYRDAGVTYLVVSWPGQGRGRVEEFISTVAPTLG